MNCEEVIQNAQQCICLSSARAFHKWSTFLRLHRYEAKSQPLQDLGNFFPTFKVCDLSKSIYGNEIWFRRSSHGIRYLASNNSYGSKLNDSQVGARGYMSPQPNFRKHIKELLSYALRYWNYAGTTRTWSFTFLSRAQARRLRYSTVLCHLPVEECCANRPKWLNASCTLFVKLSEFARFDRNVNIYADRFYSQLVTTGGHWEYQPVVTKQTLF